MYYYIINPAAGGGSINNIQDKLKATLSRLQIEGEFVKTIGPGDAAKLTRRAIEQKFKTIVAVGGDETVNEVAAAAYQSDRPVAVGIIPIGKANTLARRLGIRSWRQACTALAGRRLVKIHLLTVNGQLFIHHLKLASQSKPLRYHLTADHNLAAEGTAHSLKITNSRLHDPAAANSLLVKISGAAIHKSGLISKLSGRRSHNKQSHDTQLQAKRLELKLSQPAEARFDGATLTQDHFKIALTDTDLTFVCGREYMARRD